MKNSETKPADMQPGSEEAGVKLDVSVQEEKSLSTNKDANKVEEPAIANVNINVNISEQTSNEAETSLKIPVQEVVSTENEIIFQEKHGVSSGIIFNIEAKDMEDSQEENDVKLIFEAEQDGQESVQNGEQKLEGQKEKRSKDDKGEELPIVQDELKNGVHEKDEQSELQTDTESSVEIVESTTSEVSEMSESVTQSTMPKSQEKIDDTLNDASFVSYDSAIMLKDVQIKLNDCLKDNSKLFDESNTEDPSQFSKETFGKTLRNISGRHSINKMRLLGFPEKRISPNSSLFVNTSTISIPQDEGLDAKALHYSALSESLPTNGSSLDRKRKNDTLIWNLTKKQKTETESSSSSSSLLNTPMNLFRSFRRSTQVSTPNVTSYKFESTKLDISGKKDDDNKITAESTESTKKWCVIM